MYDNAPRGFRPCSRLTEPQQRFLWSLRDTVAVTDVDHMSFEQKALHRHGGMPWFGYKESAQSWDGETAELMDLSGPEALLRDYHNHSSRGRNN